jgi:hypothetical protein
MPGAGHIRGTTDGGPLKGGAPRVVWQTLGTDPHAVSARSAAQRLDQLGRASHLVWNPLHGEVVQLIPVLRAGRSLGWSEDLNQLFPPRPAAGTVAGLAQQAAAARPAAGELADVNAEGRVCVQVCVVACAWDPFTSSPMTGLQQILRWLDSWGVPRQWPAGRPAPFPHGLTTCGERRLWARGGHFGASQVPGLTSAGPGAIDIELLTGRASHPANAAAGSLANGRGGKGRAIPAEMRDLDGYFGHDERARPGALSRVG